MFHNHGIAIFKILVWVYLLGGSTVVFATSKDVQLSKPSGRVSLFSFERGHLRTLTEGANSEVVLTMAPRYFEAYLFECNATYPVQWAYIGEASPVVTADVGRFFKDFYDVSTYTYQSILLMYTLQEMQSGRYICRGASKEHDKFSIHYDVFVPGNGTQVLLSTTEKKLFVPENKEHAYIPCGVSDSTAAINLYRGNQWGTFYPVPVNGSITFNPRKGFKVRFKDFLDPWGTYLCVSEGNKRRRKVHLIPESLKAKYDLINHVNGKIPVYFSYEYEYNRILCCTGTNFIPKLQWAGCGSILDCQVKSACFEEDRCEPRLGNSGYNPSKWIDPGPLPPGCSGYRLRDDPNGDFGLFKCSTPGIAQYQPYLLNRGNIFLDFEKTPPSEMILTLQRISPEGPSYVGDEVEFHCNSTRFYFSYGIRWGWEKHSGEIDFIDDSTVIRDKYSVRGHRRRTTFKIPHSDIKSLICFVPVVNSATEWRTVSLPLVIASNDVNYISPQENPARNHVIDLDTLTYHTDYDTVSNISPDLHQPQQQNHLVQPTALPEPHQPQAQPLVDLQVYNSAKAPYQEFQQPIIPSSAAENHHSNKNPHYYSYNANPHVESVEHISSQHAKINSYQQHSIPPNDNLVHPIPQPDTVDIYSPSVQLHASTPLVTPSPKPPKVKKSKSRSGDGIVDSRSKTISLLTPEGHYDTSETDHSQHHNSHFDSFEPRPSSSSHANSRLHGGETHRHHKAKSSLSSSRTQYPTSSSKLPISESRRRNDYLEEVLYKTPKKSYRDHDYDNFNEEHEIDTETRLSLPFEPATTPVTPRSRNKYAKGSNYTTIANQRKSSSSRSNSKRPSTTHQQNSSRRTSKGKDYVIENSFSQHVRLSVPGSTQVPKLQKSSRSRNRASYAPNKNHTKSSRHHQNNHQNSPDYYYYGTDELQLEGVDGPVTKSQKSYSNAPRSSSKRHRHHQGEHEHSHLSTSQPLYHNYEEIYPDSGVQQEELHDSSPPVYSRRRPYKKHRYASRSHINAERDHISRSHHHSHYYPQQLLHHHSHSPQHGGYHHYHHADQPNVHESYKSSGRHRSHYSRGLKFDTNDSENQGAVEDAYELTSPTARPSYYYSTLAAQQESPHSQLHQPGNELANNHEVDMKLQRGQPHHPHSTTSIRPSLKSVDNSSDIMHSVSISISSRISHGMNKNGSGNKVSDYNQAHSTMSENQSNAALDSALVVGAQANSEVHEAEDYDIYSPQYTNYGSSNIAPNPNLHVPIQFLHVKPTEMSSFRPAKSALDDDDDDDIG